MAQVAGYLVGGLNALHKVMLGCVKDHEILSKLHEMEKGMKELCQQTALADDMKELFEEELALLLKAAAKNTLDVGYVEGCCSRFERTHGAIRMMRSE